MRANGIARSTAPQDSNKPARTSNGRVDSVGQKRQKLAPQVRLVGIETAPELLRTFANCFEQHDISVTVDSAANGETTSGLVHAGVVMLDKKAIDSLSASRHFADGRGLIFGVGPEHRLLNLLDIRFNVLLEECTEPAIRSAVHKTAPFLHRRATLHDRVPIVSAVTLSTGEVSFNALTVNVGCGGMAVRLRRAADLPARVRVTWNLNRGETISLDATPRWSSGRTVGLQYVGSAPNALKKWILAYSSRLK